MNFVHHRWWLSRSGHGSDRVLLDYPWERWPSRLGIAARGTPGVMHFSLVGYLVLHRAILPDYPSAARVVDVWMISDCPRRRLSLCCSGFFGAMETDVSDVE